MPVTVLCACGCGRVVPTAKYPSQQARYIHGHNPSATLRPEAIQRRFLSRVEKTESWLCWTWLGSVRHFGHGHLNVAGKRTLAHRYAWELWRGAIPAGVDVLHRCDNPRCVNPDHLFLGTQADNMADMTAKGRRVRGTAHGEARLTEADVVVIRLSVAAGVSHAAVAVAHGIARATVYDIVNRDTWSHVRSAA